MTLPRTAGQALLLFLLIAVCLSASAQKEFSIWLFGTNNGIDFRSGTPVAITNPNLNMFDYEGVTARCDANGNLLFYSDGEIVYNRQHNVMLNGTGLHGNLYASQSVITVRAMQDTTLFYLFTVDYGGGTNAMSYSIVDMKEDNGFGAVTTKNVPLLSNPTEQLCAVKHCNGRDIWVISHQWESDAYYAYLVTPAGVSSTPVISHSGRQVLPGAWGYGNKIGCMKTSPDGKKIAAAFASSGADVSDFDNSTGMVSNSLALPILDAFFSTTFGVEFSPSSRLLYITYYYNSNTIIYQFDVLAGSPAAITASKTKIAEQNFFGYVSTLQTGPDGKIYAANYGTTRVSIIHQPDIAGTGCNFEWEGLQLIGSRSSHGFPSYIESKYDPEPLIAFSVGCPLQNISFHYDKPDYVLSVKWDFGDPLSGSANSSTDLNPVHEYTAEGSYMVKLIRYNACNSDTLEKEISVKKLSVDLGNDTSVCANTGYLLKSAAGNNIDYLWQDGSSNSDLLAHTSGLYWLQITDQATGCSMRDSVMLDIRAAPDFTLGPDQATCEAEIHFDISVPGSSYQWSTGSHNKSISVSTSGLYWLQVNDGECFYRDSIEVTFNRLSINLGPDTTVCNAAELVLDAGNPAFDYTWQDGSKGSRFIVKDQGLYIVEASNGVCTTKDSVQVNYNKKPVFSLGKDKEFCKGDSVILGDHLEKSYSYVWENGSTSATRTVQKPGTYQITGSNGCGSLTDEIVVRPGGCVLAVPNAFTPDGDGKNEVFSVSKTELLLSFSMHIFNRWGQKIFETRDQAQGWNGTWGGRTCDVGTYPYIIQYRKTDGVPVTLKGVVLLIR